MSPILLSATGITRTTGQGLPVLSFAEVGLTGAALLSALSGPGAGEGVSREVAYLGQVEETSTAPGSPGLRGWVG